MKLKQLNPEIAWKLIESHQNTLPQKTKQLHQQMEKALCPICGGALQFELNCSNPFLENGMPRFIGICLECGHKVDLESGLSLTD